MNNLSPLHKSTNNSYGTNNKNTHNLYRQAQEPMVIQFKILDDKNSIGEWTPDVEQTHAHKLGYVVKEPE